MKSHNKSAKEQVKGGFVMAGELVGGFLVFLLAAIALKRLTMAGPTYHYLGPLTPLLELCFATAVMFCTAERWAGFIPGFLFFWGAVRAIDYATFSSSPRIASGVTRVGAALFAAYCIIMIALL